MKRHEAKAATTPVETQTQTPLPQVEIPSEGFDTRLDAAKWIRRQSVARGLTEKQADDFDTLCYCNSRERAIPSYVGFLKDRGYASFTADDVYAACRAI